MGRVVVNLTWMISYKNNTLLWVHCSLLVSQSLEISANIPRFQLVISKVSWASVIQHRLSKCHGGCWGHPLRLFSLLCRSCMLYHCGHCRVPRHGGHWVITWCLGSWEGNPWLGVMLQMARISDVFSSFFFGKFWTSSPDSSLECLDIITRYKQI